MRLKTLVRCSASFGALALGATPLMAQTPGNPAGQTNSADQTSATNAAQGTLTNDQPAADQPQNPEGEIIVTGLRQSLQSQQNLRRNSEQIVDAVVAEDIGKLPDLNTAQTAARIPGVQIYRQGGEASNVLVRGLPNFTTTYNGREIFTAETRVVALQDFPSSNIAALEVFKTSTADLVEPGLAGLVNIRSRRPFDFHEAQFAGSAWGLYTRQGQAVTPNFNALVTKTWDTSIGRIGVLVNGSYDSMEYLDLEVSNTDFIANPFVNGQEIRLPDIQRLNYRSGRRQRPSVNASVQWAPSDSLEFYGEFLWQGFRNQIDDRNFEEPLYGGSAYNNLVFRPGTNLVSSGQVVNPGGNLFGFQGATYNRTDTFQYAGGVRFNKDRFHATLDIARTDSQFRGSTESLDRVFNGARTVNFDLEQPYFTVTGPDFTNPSGQNFQGLYEENQRSAGQDWQVRGDLQYDFDTPLIRNIQLGGRWTTRDTQREFGSRYAYLLPLGINLTALPGLEFDLFNGVDGNGTYQFVSPTYDSIRDNLTGLRQFIINRCPQILPTDPGNGCATYTTTPVTAAPIYTGHETTLAGYAQLNLGNVDTISGIIGVRVERDKTLVAGPVPTGIPTVDDGTEQTNWLPNASIRWRVSPEVQLRLAASKTVTRPNFQDLTPSITIDPQGGGPAVGTDAVPRTGRGGDPNLRSFTSWNYDAAIEYYFSRAGFMSLTGFHRDLDGFIQTRTFRFTDPTYGVVSLSGPTNTGKGRITGAEFQAQTFFDWNWVPQWARSFGIQANVTYLDAKTQQINGTNGLLEYFPITDPFIGVSRWNYNLVGMYEHGGLSARLTFNGRSSFAVTRQYRGCPPITAATPVVTCDDIYTETAHPSDRLDLSLNYNLFSNFTIFGDWTNITRGRFSQDLSSARAGAERADYVRYVRDDESTISLGIRFRFGR